MPSLTTVTLSKRLAFLKKKTVHTKSPSPSSPSFLDITPALQRYLSFPLSFKHKSSHVHHQLIQYNTNYIPPSSHIPPSFHSRLPYKPTTSIHHSSLPHSSPFHHLPIPSPPPTPSNPPRLPQTPHCMSTHTQNTNKQERGTTHTPSPPSHFLPILDVGPRNHSYHTLEVHFRTMEMFKTAVYSVECLKEKPIASPVVGTVIHHITHRM